MPERFKVLDSQFEEGVSFKDKDDPAKVVNMNKHLLLLEREGGEQITDVEHWLVPSKPPFASGDTVDGELVNKPKGGVKLTRARLASGSPPSPPGSPSPSPSPPPLSDSRTHAIQRQHSQEMALRFIDASEDSGEFPASEAYLNEAVKPLIDWFERDIS